MGKKLQCFIYFLFALTFFLSFTQKPQLNAHQHL